MKPFTETLRQLDRGTLIEDLETELAEVVAAVRETGKAGKLKLTLTIKPANSGNVETLLVNTAVDTTKPTPERGVTLFYATDENELLREDPKQFKLELKTLSKAEQPLKEVAANE